MVPLAFPAGAYPLIQGQPFQKPVNRLRRRNGRQHHRSGTKAVRDARHTLRIERYRGTLSRVHALCGTPEGGRHASGIRGDAHLTASQYGAAGLPGKEGDSFRHRHEGVRGGALPHARQMVFRNRVQKPEGRTGDTQPLFQGFDLPKGHHVSEACPEGGRKDDGAGF